VSKLLFKQLPLNLLLDSIFATHRYLLFEFY